MKTDCTKIRCQFMNPVGCEMHDECPDYTKPFDLDNFIDILLVKRWIWDELNYMCSINDVINIVNKVGFNKDKIVKEVISIIPWKEKNIIDR